MKVHLKFANKVLCGAKVFAEQFISKTGSRDVTCGNCRRMIQRKNKKGDW